MEKRKYVKPEITEESQILTVRAWVTATQRQLQQPTTNTSYVLNAAVQQVSLTSQSIQQAVTRSSVVLQTIITRTSVAVQTLLTRFIR
jgi:hypothetical protein